MSLSISSSDPTSRVTYSDDAKKTDDSKKTHAEFDFAGRAYGAVHLPSGLIGTRATKTELVNDTTDFAKKVEKVVEDLKSPELRHLLGAEVSLGYHAGLVIADAASLGANAVGALSGNLLALAKAVKAGAGLVKESYELIVAAHECKTAMTPSARAKQDELLRDLKEMEIAGAKFGNTARRYGVGF